MERMLCNLIPHRTDAGRSGGKKSQTQSKMERKDRRNSTPTFNDDGEGKKQRCISINTRTSKTESREEEEEMSSALAFKLFNPWKDIVFFRSQVRVETFHSPR